MREQNDAGQRRSALLRAVALFCVLSLFLFVGIVLFLTPNAYAGTTIHSITMSKSALTLTIPIEPVATDTPIPTPTDTPIPVPTDTPIPTPTNTPVPIPTDTPIPTPTDTPVPTPTNTPIPPTATPTKVPGITPTVVVKPTSTSAAGVPPGGIPTVGSTQQGTPTPTPSPSSSTATPSRSGLPPTSTSVVPSPTPNGYSTAVAGQNNGQLLMPSVPELAIGSSILGAAAVVGWFVWRRRQGTLVSSAGYQLAQTQPAAYDSSHMSYGSTVFAGGNTGMVRENRAFYQDGTTAQAMTHMPETPLPHQAIMDTLEPSLETIMRQAQAGLFALPDKEVYS